MNDVSSRWSDCGQIFFDHGKAFGLNDDLSTVCLGDEEAVKVYLAGEKVEGLNPAGQAALDWIVEYREQEGFGNDGLGKRSVERISTGRTTRNTDQKTGISKTQKGLAQRIVDKANKGLSRR